MSGLDGALKVAVRAKSGRVDGVRIASPRVNVSPVFVGRSPSEAVSLAKNLFSLCPAAQSLAAQAAAEAASGLAAGPDEQRRRALLLLAERYVEMLRGNVLDWPREEAPGADSVELLRETLQILRALPDSPDAGAAIARVEAAALKLGLRDYSSGNSLFPSQWAEVAADEAHWDLRQDNADFLRPSDDDAVARAMSDPKFALSPRLPGRCVETGACARRAGADLVETLTGRLAARFADMAATLDAIAALIGGGDAPPGLLEARSAGPGEGFAAVDSARGRLYHALRLDNAGGIADYSIVAPTEWNFHPDGPFARVLRGANIGTGAAAKLRVARLAFVFDPCIRVGVQIMDDADA